VGESQATGFGVGFNGSVRIVGRWSRITGEGGVLLLRDLDDALGLTAGIAASLGDSRCRPRFSVQQLLRLRIFLLALGYGHQSDCDLLRDDPALRLAVSDERGTDPLDQPLPSQPTSSRLTQRLASDAGIEALEAGLVSSALNGMRLSAAPGRHTLDIDSLPIAAHGLQGGSEYNGGYRYRCFHPQVVMHGETGFVLAAKLRPGNEGTSTGATELLVSVIDRVQEAGGRVDRVRGDAGFPSEELLSTLEERGIGYVFRFKNNSRLDTQVEHHLKRPPGRRPKKPREWTHVMTYQAARWTRARRMVLVVQERPDDLFLHHFFLLTSDESTTGRQVLNCYRRRGTMEGRLGEWMHTLRPVLSSSHRDGSLAADGDDAPFRANAATYLLSSLAYNLLHTLRVLAARSRLEAIGDALGLGRARRILLAVAGRMIVSARRAWLHVPEHTARMWRRILGRLRTRASASSLA